MIARTWRGVTRADDADAYLAYLKKTGLADYRATAGNRGVIVQRAIDGDRAIFELTTFWESEQAIARFAGDDVSVAGTIRKTTTSCSSARGMSRTRWSYTSTSRMSDGVKTSRCGSETTRRRR